MVLCCIGEFGDYTLTMKFFVVFTPRLTSPTLGVEVPEIPSGMLATFKLIISPVFEALGKAFFLVS